jgi:hypothetical protein
MLRGDAAAARDRFVTAHGLALRTGDVMQQAKTTMLLGRTDMALGDDEHGWAQLAQGLLRLQRLAQKEETLLALDMAAEALQMRGHCAAATRLRAATSSARTQWPRRTGIAEKVQVPALAAESSVSGVQLPASVDDR